MCGTPSGSLAPKPNPGLSPCLGKCSWPSHIQRQCSLAHTKPQSLLTHALDVAPLCLSHVHSMILDVVTPCETPVPVPGPNPGPVPLQVIPLTLPLAHMRVGPVPPVMDISGRSHEQRNTWSPRVTTCGCSWMERNRNISFVGRTDHRLSPMVFFTANAVQLELS